jgi:hypothetical protein
VDVELVHGVAAATHVSLYSQSFWLVPLVGKGLVLASCGTVQQTSSSRVKRRNRRRFVDDGGGMSSNRSTNDDGEDVGVKSSLSIIPRWSCLEYGCTGA